MRFLDYTLLAIVAAAILWGIRKLRCGGGCCSCSGNCASCSKCRH